MKVLHFFKTYYPDSLGGIEQLIYQLAEGGRSLGIDAQVLSLSPRGRFRDQMVGRHRVHGSALDLYLASTGFSLSVFRDFRALAAEADIVHYHFPWPFMDLVHFASRLRKPSLLTYHSDIIKQQTLLKLYRPLMSCFMRSVDHIVATSPNYLATSAVLGQYRDKVSVIPIGLDPGPGASAERLAYWRARCGQRFFLFVGALRYYKGLHILLDAMAGVDYPLLIIGAGPIEHELKAQAQALGLRHVQFLGALPDADKCALLQLCHAVVFPSHLRSEAFGISLLEGAMHGKPMLSSEIGTGTSYINIHGETGLVVPPSDPPALRQAMTLLWQDAALAQACGARARARYQQCFTASRMVARYAELYRQLLAGRSC